MLRAQVEQLQRQQRVEKVQGVQGESTRRESGLEEDWNMEVAEEVDNKKKLDEQRKRLQKELREIEKFSDMDQRFGDGQKEKWKEDLQEVEKKLDEEMRKVRDEIK